MFHRRIVHSLVAAVALVAHVPSPSRAQQPQPPAAKPEATKPPEIRIIDAGDAAKRATIRVRPTAGAVQHIAMRMKMDVTMDVDGHEFPTPTPGMEFTMKIVVDKVDPNGDFQFTMSIVNTDLYDTDDVAPATLSAMRSALKDAAQLKGGLLLNDRNIVQSGNFSTANPMMKQLIESMNQTMFLLAAPVPEEAIGVGAKWEVKTHTAMNGIRLENVAVYTIIEHAGAATKVSFEQTTIAGKQDVDFPTLPAGSKMHVKSMNGKSKGSMVFDETKAMSEQAEVNFEQKADMSISADGQTAEMKQRVKLKMTLAPAKAPAPDAEKKPEVK